MISGPDRGRRSGAFHARLCARAGCGTRATATLRFQPNRRIAWLVDIDEATNAPGQGDVCSRHADALVLPRGWRLRDERSISARGPVTLTAVPDVAPDPDPVPEPVQVPEPVVAAARAPEPDAEPVDDFAAVLDARTPLLRRAFANVLPIDGSG